MKQRKANKPQGQEPFHNPFLQQAHLLPKKKRKQKERKPSIEKAAALAPKLPKAPKGPVSDEDAFAKAMADVTPLSHRVDTPALVERPVEPVPSDEDEVRWALEALVKGGGDFDLYYSDEFVEGALEGTDVALIERLREGEFAWQGYLDLHGMRVEEAKSAVAEFIETQKRKNHRCLLLVHGRGQHSPERIPILKQRLVNWMIRGFLRKQIMAFATAKNYDGGAGALYILLA